MRTFATSVLTLVLIVGLSGVTMGQNEGNQDTQEASFQTLMAALNNIEAQLTKLESAQDLTAEDVEVVDAKTLVDEEHKEAFKSVVDQNKAQIEKLRAALSGNQAVSDALESKQVMASSAIAVEVMSDGKVRVYQHKKDEAHNEGEGDQQGDEDSPGDEEQ